MRARMLLVPLAAAAALLAGCTTTTPQVNVTPTPTTNGLESMTADEILDKAIEALSDAKSFHCCTVKMHNPTHPSLQRSTHG